MNKKLKHFLSTSALIATTVSPIAVVVSCGSNDKGTAPQAQQNGNTGNTGPAPTENPGLISATTPFSSVIGNVLGDGESATFMQTPYQTLQGTIANGINPSRRLDVASGYNRQSEVDSPEKAGVLQERLARIKDGMPIYPNMDGADFWNWSPEGASMDQTSAEAKAFADSAHHRFVGNGYMQDGSGTLAPDTYQNAWMQTKTWGISNNEYWWQPRDYKYSRATIRKVAPYTYGEKLKPTQSPYAPMSWFTALASSANIHAGLMDYNEGYKLMDAWTYTKMFMPGGTSSQEWVQIPDGNAIDVAHKNGTTILGNINWTGKWTIDIALRKDVNGDYPFVKSLVNIADFYGFDGWVFDNEINSHDSNLQPWRGDYKTAIAKMQQEYLKYARDVNPYPTTTGLTKEIYKKWNFDHRPQMVSNYTFPWSNDELGATSDYDLHPQGKGTVANGIASTGMKAFDTARPTLQMPDLYDSSKGETVKEVQRKGFDLFSYTDGWNPGEEGGLDDLRRASAKHINNSMVGLDYDMDEDQMDAVNPEIKNHQFENRLGWWNWLFSSEDDTLLRATYASAVGDPRYSALSKGSGTLNASRASVSDAIQERTAITGRKPWGTNFSIGKGKSFNLFGGKDISQFVNRGENGWRDQGLQSFLPTYKFIVDEYDENGTLTTNPKTLDDKGHVVRNIEPSVLGIDGDNWIGGSSLKYAGKLAKAGMAFENKLYASSIPTQSGDRFKVVIKNDSITPELLAWTADGEVKTHSIYENGTNGHDQWPTQTEWGSELYNRGIYNYTNPSSWNVQRDKHTIAPSAVTPLGNTGWSEVEYDLSELDGKTIMDFGVKATAPRDDFDFTNKLVIGKMAFEPSDYDPEDASWKINISNLKTDFVWDAHASTCARISWDADKRANSYLVFKANDEWKPTNLTWVDARPAAYIDHIARTATEQKLIIVAIDDTYNVVSATKATIKTGVTGGSR